MTDDWIRLRQIRLFAYHGVYPEERKRGQLFETDVELQMDARASASSDALSDTVDYVAVYEVVHRIVSDSPVSLLETLVERIAQEILRSFTVAQVVVRMRKPHAPMPGPVGAIEVEVRRWREKG